MWGGMLKRTNRPSPFRPCCLSGRPSGEGVVIRFAAPEFEKSTSDSTPGGFGFGDNTRTGKHVVDHVHVDRVQKSGPGPVAEQTAKAGHREKATR